MGMKQYRVPYQLLITGDIEVMAENEDDADYELESLAFSDLVENYKCYEVYALEEPEEVK